jgi:hypothetical protein
MFEACVKQIFHTQYKDGYLKTGDIVYLYFDSSEKDAPDHLKTYIKIRSSDLLVKRGCALIAFGEDDLMEPLQAVDMLAYCYFQDLQRKGNTPEPIIEDMLTILNRGEECQSPNLVYDITKGVAGLGSGTIEGKSPSGDGENETRND